MVTVYVFSRQWYIYIYIYIYICVCVCLEYIYMYIYIYIIIIIMSCRQHGYPWPTLATSPYHFSPLAGLQCYILCPHIVAVYKFELVVLLLHGHMWGSIGVLSRFVSVEVTGMNYRAVWLIPNMKNVKIWFYASDGENSVLKKWVCWVDFHWDYSQVLSKVVISFRGLIIG